MGSAEFGGATAEKLKQSVDHRAAEADGKRIGRIRMALSRTLIEKPSTASFKTILS